MNAEKQSRKPGVYYNKVSQAWTANIYVNRKQYFLGNHQCEEDAVKQRVAAEKHKEDGTFLEWLNDMREQKRAYNGVHYKANGQKFFPKISINNKAYHLGYYPDRETAAKVRRIADKHKRAGTFFDWYQSEIKNRNKIEGGTTVTNIRRIINNKVKCNNKSGHTGVFQAKNKKWKAEMYIMHQKYTASGFGTKEEAINERKRFENRFLIDFIRKYEMSDDPIYVQLVQEIKDYFQRESIDIKKAEEKSL